jgi:hypothetical protein
MARPIKDLLSLPISTIKSAGDVELKHSCCRFLSFRAAAQFRLSLVAVGGPSMQE